jgi:predicted PurR-regulated permease PerM
MTRGDSEQGQSIYRLRWVGYGLLLLALFDVIESFIPPNFTNPVWEFQTLGLLVERVAVPLLGLVLIFFGESFNRSRLEGFLLRLLSWLCLLFAIIFLALVPLGILNTSRINDLTNNQINSTAQAQLTQLKQVEDEVSKGTTEDIRQLGNQLTNVGIQVDATNPEQLKEQILERIPPARKAIQEQAMEQKSTQKMGLLKNSVKWNLGALVASVLFFILWKSTRWAR